MEQLKTKLKFVKSSRSQTWVGFVTINPTTGYIQGVNEDDERPKKVCVVTQDLASSIEPGVLYDVYMVPMKKEKAGYIVVAAKPHVFNAKISTTVIQHAIYRVDIKFGNKSIKFDPMNGIKDCVRTIDGVTAILRSRKDINDLDRVIANFQKSANIVMAAFGNDMHNNPNTQPQPVNNEQ